MTDLFSHTERYHVLEEVGRGTFGTVSKCWRRGDGELVAVKMLKFDPHRNRVIRNELKLIRAVCREDLTNCHIVRFFEDFRDQSHHYLVFELLEKSLHQLQRENGFKPMTVRTIRVITCQMLKALKKLKELAIIHADVKPENVMLVDHSRYPFRVKLIDFGSASIFSEVRFVKAPYIQSRYYRAPEVLLGLPFSERMDMWSLGCVMSELYLGWPLYPGASEMEQVRYICETQGLPHVSLLHSASKTHLFFNRSRNSSGATRWQLKTDRKCLAPWEVMGQGQGRGEGLGLGGGGGGGQERRKHVLRSLDQLSDMEPRDRGVELRQEDAEAEEVDRHCMVNLLKRILTLDSNLRISPTSALRHSFLTLTHLSGSARSGRYLQNATQAMEQASVCVTAPAQISRHVPPRPPGHPAQDHPNGRPRFSRQLREVRLPGPVAPLCGASDSPWQVPGSGVLHTQLDEPSFTGDPRALGRPTDVQNRWERPAAIRASLPDAAMSDLRCALRSLGLAGGPSALAPRPWGGSMGGSSSSPYQLFPPVAQSPSTGLQGCRPGPDVATPSWTPETPAQQGVTFSDYPHPLPQPTATLYHPLGGFQQSHHHHGHPGAVPHRFPQGEPPFWGQLGGQGLQMHAAPSSFLPHISTPHSYRFQRPARSSQSDPARYGLSQRSGGQEGYQETHPALHLLYGRCTRVAPHRPPPRHEVRMQDRNAVQTQDEDEVQIPVPVKKLIDVQTQTTEPGQYEVHIELRVKPQPQQQPQAPVSQAENQPQESSVQPWESPCQCRAEAKDQGAEIDDHQSPSTEDSAWCGAEVGRTRHSGQHSQPPSWVWDTDTVPTLVVSPPALASPLTSRPAQRGVRGEEDYGGQTDGSLPQLTVEGPGGTKKG